jgi:hypothetical protein
MHGVRQAPSQDVQCGEYHKLYGNLDCYTCYRGVRSFRFAWLQLRKTSPTLHRE